MEELSPEHRSVIVLREIDGLSYTEISEVVGCSKGTVMSRLHHARKKLQTLLRDLMPQQETETRDCSEERATIRKKKEKTGVKQTV
jgi:RNA polymerase sigma-70 factor (ECF subfamily)